jgi:hypothetical protein
VLATGSTLAYSENQAATAINTAITVADADSTTLASATVQITANYASSEDVLAFTNVGMGNIAGVWNSGTGTMALSSAGATATLAQWQAALRAVTYANSSDDPGTAARTVSFTVNDGALASNTVTSTVNVTAVNDAPVLANTALSLTVAEDAGAPAGAVGSLLSAFTGGITDVDSSASLGVAVTATVETNGTWYYSTNSGSSWTLVGAVTNTSALLLADNASTRLYFAPTANFNGSSAGALTLRGWDQTSGAAGTKVTTATNGGTSAFSSATASQVCRSLTMPSKPMISPAI